MPIMNLAMLLLIKMLRFGSSAARNMSTNQEKLDGKLAQSHVEAIWIRLTILTSAMMIASSTWIYKAMHTPKWIRILNNMKRKRSTMRMPSLSPKSRSIRPRPSPSPRMPRATRSGAFSRCSRIWRIEDCFPKRCSLTWITTAKIMLKMKA